MLISNGKLTHVYEEVLHEGMRLGRHLELDARSLLYTIEKELAEAKEPAPIKPASHWPSITVLDQSHLHAQGIAEPGDPDGLGSCTGNAGTYHLASAVGSDGLPAAKLNGLELSSFDAKQNERFAIELYHEATVRDSVETGTAWPPDDTGSTGLAICQSLKTAGLIAGYQWATSVVGIAVLLQRGGVIIGMPWLEAFFAPDADGFIDADSRWSDSPVAGGHEIYIAELEKWDETAPEKSVVRFPNSWGQGWGVEGWGRMRLSTYLALQNQVDVKQYVMPKAA